MVSLKVSCIIQGGVSVNVAYPHWYDCDGQNFIHFYAILQAQQTAVFSFFLNTHNHPAMNNVQPLEGSHIVWER